MKPKRAANAGSWRTADPRAIAANRKSQVAQHKYGAIRTTVDGITFASKAEARRYSELKLLEKAGEIRGLELQPKFPLEVSGTKVATYIADFKYFRAQMPVIEDVKGMRTPAYRLKKKMFEAQYGVQITEVA